MKLILYSLSLIFYASPCFSVGAIPGVNVFDFGDNQGRTLYVNSGSIGPLEKIKTVNIELPDCTLLWFVRVKVSNPYEVPTVDLDWQNSIVTIEYNQSQFSESQFNIIGKALRNPFCGRSGAPSDADEIESGKPIAEIN